MFSCKLEFISHCSSVRQTVETAPDDLFLRDLFCNNHRYLKLTIGKLDMLNIGDAKTERFFEVIFLQVPQ